MMSADPEQPDPSPLSVAIAEDDEQQREMLGRLVRQIGHRVVCVAENGQELVRSCEETMVEVALVDLDMPVVDGLEAAETLAERGVRVILFSGHDEVDRLVLEREPVAATLRKPISSAALAATLRDVVG